MAMNISFTFIEVFADVSIKSKLLSSAYDCASYENETNIRKPLVKVTLSSPVCMDIGQSNWHNFQFICNDSSGPVYIPQSINKDLKNTHLEVQCSLVCEISLVPSQSYYNIWTGLSLKLFNPVLRPYKWLLVNITGRGGGDLVSENNNKIHVMERWG